MKDLTRFFLLLIMISALLISLNSLGEEEKKEVVIDQKQVGTTKGEGFPISVSVAKALTGYDKLPKKWMRNISISIIGDGINIWNDTGDVVEIDVLNSTTNPKANQITYTDLILSMYSSDELDILNHTSISVYASRPSSIIK